MRRPKQATITKNVEPPPIVIHSIDKSPPPAAASDDDDDDENQPLAVIATQMPTATVTTRFVEKLRIKLPSISPNYDSSNSSNTDTSNTINNNNHPPNAAPYPSTPTTSKPRRFCVRCCKKFRHTVDFHAHLKTHVMQPTVVLRALSPTHDPVYRAYLRKTQYELEQQQEEQQEETTELRVESLPAERRPPLSVRTDLKAPAAATNSIPFASPPNTANCNDSSSSGGLKLRLKIDANSRRFSVSTDIIQGITNHNNATAIASAVSPSRPPSARILRASDCKLSPTFRAAVSTSNNGTTASLNAGMMPAREHFKPDPASTASLHFECPTLDGYGLADFAARHSANSHNNAAPQNHRTNAAGECEAEESLMNSGDAAQLLRDLLENPTRPSDDDMDADWPGAAGASEEFMSIERLMHICTVCHKNFADAALLHQHRQQTGHDGGGGGGGMNGAAAGRMSMMPATMEQR